MGLRQNIRTDVFCPAIGDGHDPAGKSRKIRTNDEAPRAGGERDWEKKKVSPSILGLGGERFWQKIFFSTIVILRKCLWHKE
jgi:hypothetical protein